MSGQEPSEGKPRNRPNQDEDRGRVEQPAKERPLGSEFRGVQEGITDADKRARIGTEKEPVRNTPPSGEWNETSPD
jgi:hypothetical protein